MTFAGLTGYSSGLSQLPDLDFPQLALNVQAPTPISLGLTLTANSYAAKFAALYPNQRREEQFMTGSGHVLIFPYAGRWSTVL